MIPVIIQDYCYNGKGYGKLLSLLEILKVPYEEVRPQKWKKEFSLIGKGKDHSVSLAEKLEPNENFKTPRNRLMDGKAESFLMAEYGRRKQL